MELIYIDCVQMKRTVTTYLFCVLSVFMKARAFILSIELEIVNIRAQKRKIGASV
jgi:hypothetical protein